MSDEYRKILNHPEARHRYWYITTEDRDFFPPTDKIFKLKFHDKVYDMKVNHKGDMMTGLLYEKYRFLEGNSITIKKDKAGVYVLTANDVKPW